MAQDGTTIPTLGLGTYGRRGKEGIAAMLAAIEIGYRHFDTAQMYDTEIEVGQAIRRSGLPRRLFFVTTKIRMENFARGRLIPSLRKSLDDMQIDQADLTLIHWPSPHDSVPLETYMTALKEAQTLGLTRLIGVSNFTIALIDKTEALLGPGALATNQVEIHPYLQNRKLRDHCIAHGITPTAYQPLARGRVANDPVIRRIADANRADPGQVALAFLLQQGLIAIPASSRTDRMRSNFEATGIALSDADMARMTSLDRGERFITMSGGPVWDQ